MSSDSSDGEEQQNGRKQSPKTDSESEQNETFSEGRKGPRTPGSPSSVRSDTRSRFSSKSRSRSPSPHALRSPEEPPRGPRSPPDNLDDDGRSNISSGSSIPSEGSLKDEPIGERENVKSSPVTKNHFAIPNAEDLSDVSDIDDSDGLTDVCKDEEPVKNNGTGSKSPEPAKAVRPQKEKEKIKDKRPSLNIDDGEQLDFEAEDQPDVEKEDGEVDVIPEKKEKVSKEVGECAKSGDEGEVDEEGAESLEEGEVSDECDPKPEKPPICRFYSRGSCTWGSNCRFLHPGVTDKGNYSMFEMTRPMVASANGLGLYPPDPRPYPVVAAAAAAAAAVRAMPPPYAPAVVVRRDDSAVESAWERGLRQAKEMMRKSTKRKEMDMDFEEKKMNLSIGQEELDKENDYYTRAASPRDDPEGWARPPPMVEPELRRPAVRVVERYEDIIPDTISTHDRYEYRRGYEKVRDPEYLLRRDKKYYEEEEMLARKGSSKKMVREVIVQRAERPKRSAPEPGRRPEEWSDPWMRSKSPNRKGHRTRKVSYSSGSSSYSGSSSRSSSNSSYSSYSRSRSGSHSRSGSGSRSPSSRLRRRSPPLGIPIRSKDSKFKALKSGPVVGPTADRPLIMNPPPPTARRPKDSPMSPSVIMRKVGLNPPAPTPKARSGKHASKGGRVRPRKSRSSSESSGSSSESSQSSYSSSSSSPGSPERVVKKIEPDERLAAATLKSKGVDALKVGGQKPQIKLTLKPEGKKEKPAAPAPVAGKKRPVEDSVPAEESGASPPKTAGAKKATSRREELLKQLKAVEDAIARKRLKI